MTTSLTKKGEIIFEGKKYAITGDNKKLILEEVARAVIDQKQDILAEQYREHDPLFRNSGICLTKSALDIKVVQSLVKSNSAISNDNWLASTLLLLDSASEQFILLEKRSEFGNRIIYKISCDGKIIKRLEIHPELTSRKFREDLFGVLENATYYVTILIVDHSKMVKLFTIIKGFMSRDVVATCDAGTLVNTILDLNKTSGTTYLIKKWYLLGLEAKSTEVICIENSKVLEEHDQQLKDLHIAKEYGQKVAEEMMDRINADATINKQNAKLMNCKINNILSKIKGLANKIDVEAITAEMVQLKDKAQFTQESLDSLEDKFETLSKHQDKNPTRVNIVNEIAYTNPLLNHPVLLKESLKLLSLGQVLDLGSNLSKELVDVAIANNDSSLILGGLVSLLGSNPSSFG